MCIIYSRDLNILRLVWIHVMLIPNLDQVTDHLRPDVVHEVPLSSTPPVKLVQNRFTITAVRFL